tara:strand:- start:16 stop:165 length:150 start_codon:yes stop_codon:yes gene_type:complete
VLSIGILDGNSNSQQLKQRPQNQRNKLGHQYNNVYNNNAINNNCRQVML